MKRLETRYSMILMLVLLMACSGNKPKEEVAIGKKVVLVIHGGAGNINRDRMTPESDSAYRAALELSLKEGYQILMNGGESCEAIIKAINLMEDNPLFNAGVGAVLTSEGENELDASIMRGSDKNAGAVAGVKTIKNPIDAAYSVMTSSDHVMFSGAGADRFAAEQGLETVDSGYFKTEKRIKSLERVQKLEKEHGTVGAVALDQFGNLCAATSTGGMTNKKWGRIGDSPIIGAGTYADNVTCGVSCTGHGEYFIRSVTAYDVSAMMEYKGYPIAQAADAVIQKTLKLGGTGGLIALDTAGNVAMPFSTTGMFRGYITEDGEVTVKIYGDE
ncbi:MAG: isoaspartyl peptidase/L-asparaginase [Cyclobacteriaceae bacterium]